MSKVSTANLQIVRRVAWTGAIAAVTIAGTWYGADLKTSHEAKQKINKQREATPTEKIAQLEEARGNLVAKRFGLEKKIRELEMRAAGATREESIQGQERRR